MNGVWLVDLASSPVKRQHRRGRIDIALQRSPLVLGGAAFAAIASQMPRLIRSQASLDKVA
jgi:hypothetical protein